MQKHPQFFLRHWHWVILQYRSIHHCTTSCELLGLKAKWLSTLPPHISIGRPHYHAEPSPHPIPTEIHLCVHMDISTTIHQYMSTCIPKGNDNEHFHFICQVDVENATEVCQQCRDRHWRQETHWHQHQQHTLWLWLTRCGWRVMTLQLVCVSPSEEWLSSGQVSWSQQHYQLPS